MTVSKQFGGKSSFRITMSLLFLLSALIACSSSDRTASTGAAPSDDQQGGRTVVIGFTASQTGKLNVESIRQINGFQLWIEEVNAKGGVQLADGSTVKFATKFYDDESNKDRVQELYTKLITQDKAEFLISPYSSGLTDAAAVIAEQYGKIMITAGAASDSTHAKGYSLVYQSYTPASRYLTGAFQLLAKLDPQARNAVLICEKDKFATEVCNAAGAEAERTGVSVTLSEGYDAGATDFAPFINKIPPGTVAVMGGGHFADTSTFARQLFEKQVPAKFIALLVAPPEPKFVELGEAALGVIGPSQWEPLANYTLTAARDAGVEWFGPSGAVFVTAYREKYKEDPSYHAAGGYAAGLILQKAIDKAGVLDTPQLKTVLDDLNLMTFFGQTRFESAAANHGLQVGHEMVYVQWQKDAQGQLHKQVVWPAAVGSAAAVYPLR